MINIPFFRQETDYSCGAATLKMVLKYFGKDIEEKDLVKLLDANPNDGTRHNRLIKIITGFNLFVRVLENATIADLQYFVKDKNIPVIVNFIEPSHDDSHYAVAIDVTEDKVIMNDPWNGPCFSVNYEDFILRWKDEKEEHIRCLIAVSDRVESLS